MNETGKKRLSKAERGYSMLCEAGNACKLLYSFDLLRIAQAINPDLKEYGARLLIVDDERWIADELSPNCRVCATHSDCRLADMRVALIFYRAEAVTNTTKRIFHAVHLVYEFPRSEKDQRKVWLNCETGLPWTPYATRCLRTRLYNAEEQKTLAAREDEDMRKAHAALNALNEQTVWVAGEHNYNEERDHERLAMQRRTNYFADWKTSRVIAERFHPPGSLLFGRAEQEAYRLKFIQEREQREAVAA